MHDQIHIAILFLWRGQSQCCKLKKKKQFQCLCECILVFVYLLVGRCMYVLFLSPCFLGNILNGRKFRLNIELTSFLFTTEYAIGFQSFSWLPIAVAYAYCKSSWWRPVGILISSLGYSYSREVGQIYTHSHINNYLWEHYLTSQTFKRALKQIYQIVRHRRYKRGVWEFPWFSNLGDKRSDGALHREEFLRSMEDNELIWGYTEFEIPTSSLLEMLDWSKGQKTG